MNLPNKPFYRSFLGIFLLIILTGHLLLPGIHIIHHQIHIENHDKCLSHNDTHIHNHGELHYSHDCQWISLNASYSHALEYEVERYFIVSTLRITIFKKFLNKFFLLPGNKSPPFLLSKIIS